MSDARGRKVDEAMQEHLKAIAEYEQLLHEYFPSKEHKLGQPIVLSKLPNEREITELDEAEAKISKTWEKFKKLTGL